MILRKLQKTLLFAGIYAILIILIPNNCSAQDSPGKDFILTVDGHYGFIISHRGSIVHMITGHIGGGELTYLFRTCGKKPWQALHRYPEFGVSAMHLYMGNPSVIGNLDAIYPYMNLRMNSMNRKFKLYLRLGVGLAHMSKPFDRITNHKNNAIGSYINAFVNIRLGSSYMLSPSWRLDAGIGLTHASNGATKTPNLGLNMATLNFGLGYVFGNKKMEMKNDSVLPKITNRWHPSIIGVFGLKEMEHPLGNKYMAYALSANLYYTVSHKNKFGTGVEFVYSNGTRKRLESDSVSTKKIKDVLKIGAKFGYSFNIDRLSIPIDFGMYFYQNSDLSEKFFHRIGLRYMVTKHLIANLSLYTHWAKADYFEFGLGYEL
ncbi:MAG: acyloxyacyl hydrolase [Bacteroidetes bacterium]|nr:acyloxyacyl hydrolase [Bacteroidota bacterium]